jgi:hypothetical protein
MDIKNIRESIPQEAPLHVDKVPPYDPVIREHIWVMNGAWRVFPKSWKRNDTGHLDLESLILLVGPGCYYCNKLYTDLESTRLCQGTPS